MTLGLIQHRNIRVGAFPFVFRRARVELGLCESASSGPKVALDYRCLKDASDLAMEKLQDRLGDFSLCTKKAD